MFKAFFEILLDAGYVWLAAILIGICAVGRYILKAFTINKICKNPELSDQKVASMAQMVSKNLFKL